MFCSKCGQELSDDASFCSKCGAPTGASSQPARHGADERQRTYELLSSIDGKLRDQRAHYRAIQKDNIKLAKARKSGKGIGKYLFSGLWALFFWQVSTTVDDTGLVAFYVVGGAVPLAICVLGALRRLQIANDVKKDIASHFASIAKIHASVKDNPLSFEHSTPYALDSLLAIVRQGRADTLKEALNVYEDDEHKSSMLDLQQAAVNEATAARIAAEQAREYAKRMQVTYYW